MDAVVGGIARTVEYRGFKFDVGGHRFFTKAQRVNQLWDEVMGEEFLLRQRLSRIFYRGKFMDYPLRAASAIRTLGVMESVASLASYFWAQLCPLPEDSFEGWVANRFGRRLYQHFFKTYTEKTWGMPCTELSADWAAQRIKSLSLWGAVMDALFRSRKTKHTTLIQQFKYPPLGPGMMWQRFRERIEADGGRVLMQHKVVKLRHDGQRVRSLVTAGPEGEQEHQADFIINSMPLNQLAMIMEPAPDEAVRQAADALRYRAFLSANLIVDRPEPFPDQWIYVHAPQVRLARLQNFKNWSPHMVPDPAKTCIGAEYFVWPDEPLWRAPDQEIIELATQEIASLGLIEADEVLDGAVIRMSHAYPVYDPGYMERIQTIRNWLQQLDNLYTIGRSGQHRYNNMDHSMMTGILAAENVLGACHDVWDVNVEQEYLETAQD